MESMFESVWGEGLPGVQRLAGGGERGEGGKGSHGGHSAHGVRKRACAMGMRFHNARIHHTFASVTVTS